jgi:hypothetical protein
LLALGNLLRAPGQTLYFSKESGEKALARHWHKVTFLTN